MRLHRHSSVGGTFRIKPIIDIFSAGKSVLDISVDVSDAYEPVAKKFYKILRKHDIKRGSPLFDEKGKQVGIHVPTDEWRVVIALFKSKFGHHWASYMMSDPKFPKDLIC